MLVAPLEKTALEVGFSESFLFQIDVLAYDTMGDKPLTVFVASIQIDGSYKSLEGISCHVVVVGTEHLVAEDKFGESNGICQTSETLSLHYAAAHTGEETFRLALKLIVEDVTHDSIEDGIAKEFEAFVV